MKKVAVIGIAGNSIFMSVDKFHNGGETVEASSIKSEPGGKGYNQAVSAARAGSEVFFLATVGNDCPDSVYKKLTESGVKSTLAKKDGNTAFASIITDKNGNNRVTVYQGVQLSKTDVFNFADRICESDVLLLNNEVSQEVNDTACEIAARAGKTIILNPAPVRKLSPEFIGHITWFTPNEHELKGIESCENIIQTLGKNGCYIKPANKIIPPIDVTSVDTTGAGDTFNGYLASLLAEGQPVDTAVKYAVVASGLSVTKPGAVSSIPDRKTVDYFISKK